MLPLLIATIMEIFGTGTLAATAIIVIQEILSLLGGGQTYPPPPSHGSRDKCGTNRVMK